MNMGWAYLALTPYLQAKNMRKNLDFYFDFGSAPSYLAHTQLSGIASRTGVELIYKPVLLGAIFKKTGNFPPGRTPEKLAWFRGDMALFARKYGVPFAFPNFPVTNTIGLLRGAFVAREQGCFAAYCDTVFEALWVKGLDIQDETVLADTLTEAGFDAGTFITGIGRQEIKEQLTATTQEAVARGVFGAPTFFTGGRLFFGQDRLEFVELAVAHSN